MRHFLQWVIAYAFACSSAVLASLYGVLSATGYYAGAKAAILGLVAFGGCHGPAYASTLKRSSGKPAAGLAVFAAGMCLIVTLWGGLGTIAGGGEEMRAERTKAAGDARRDGETLSRLKLERSRLEARPAAVVSADLTTARASPLYKSTEGCAPERITGPKARDHCKQYRQLEGELAAAEETARLDAQIVTVDGRLAHAPPPLEADPQASAFSRLTGLSVEFSAALYALAASLALEAMAMVAMMVVWAERRAPPVCTPVDKPAQVNPTAYKRERHTITHSVKVRPPQSPPIQPANVVTMQRATVFGSIRKFYEACLTPAAGDRLELQAVFVRYQGWCREGSLAPAPLEKFLDEIEAVCRKADIAISAEGDKVYCVGVRLAA